MRNILKDKWFLIAVILLAHPTTATLLFSTQGRKLGHVRIVTSTFRAEFKVWSQSIVVIFKHFDKFTKYTYELKCNFSSFESWDPKAWSCTMLDYMCNISMIFSLLLPSKLSLPYHYKIDFHIHTHTQTDTHRKTFFFVLSLSLNPSTYSFPLTYFWYSLLKASSKTK